jgi:tetraacyldisaccharide-1-P 4'-kinase
LIGFRSLPDHFAYPPSEVAQLAAWLDSLPDVTTVLCTCKDLVKLKCCKLGSNELWAVSIGLRISRGRESLEHRLQSLLESRTEFIPFAAP